MCIVVLEEDDTSLGVLWAAIPCSAVKRMVTPGSVSQNIKMHVIAPEDGIVCVCVADCVPDSNRRLSQSLADSMYGNHAECGVDMCPSCTQLLLTTE